jgi:hypothetical protein
VNRNRPACHFSATAFDRAIGAAAADENRSSSVNWKSSSVLLRVTSGSAV